MDQKKVASVLPEKKVSTKRTKKLPDIKHVFVHVDPIKK